MTLEVAISREALVEDHCQPAAACERLDCGMTGWSFGDPADSPWDPSDMKVPTLLVADANIEIACSMLQLAEAHGPWMRHTWGATHG
jgi:hypothetical protein